MDITALSLGHLHMVHTLVSHHWWCKGCSGSVGRGIVIYMFIFCIFSIVAVRSRFCQSSIIDLFKCLIVCMSFLLQTSWDLSSSHLLYFSILITYCFFYINFWCIFLLQWLINLWQIRSLEMMHKRFESFPEAFVKNLVSRQTKRYNVMMATP